MAIVFTTGSSESSDPRLPASTVAVFTFASSLKSPAGNVGDGKVPGNVRLTFEGRDDLVVQVRRQCDRNRSFRRLRPDCVQRLVRQIPCKHTPRVLLHHGFGEFHSGINNGGPEERLQDSIKSELSMPVRSPPKCRLNIPHFVARSVRIERCVPRCSKPSIDARRGGLIAFNMSMGTVITHANVRSLRNHPRNAPDDVLAALAGRGGVIGITAYAPFCESSPGQRPGLEHFHPGWK